MEATLDNPVAVSWQPQDDTELKLRPQRLSEVIGQAKVKNRLSVAIAAARARGEQVIDHALLYGPPGLGKTTLSNIIANELAVPVKTVNAASIEKPAQITGLLTELLPGSVLFIDEIHRLPMLVEEVLYPVMEDFTLHIALGKDKDAKTMSVPLAPFTLVGATTRAGMLSDPLRDRFGLLCDLELYEPDDLEKIVLRSAAVMGVTLTKDGAGQVASRSRGTPRIANRLLRRVRDYADVYGGGVVTEAIADQALSELDIDALGLDRDDRRYLTTIIERYKAGPVGQRTLCAVLDIDDNTADTVIEPFLLRIGFLERTPQGRVATEAACAHLGLDYPKKKAAA